MSLRPLHAQKIPLSGKHLIEASAGTGKTFNITRIYLRLLLERELSVEQILVMTFTKDATEEIKSRIGTQLRAALANWDELIENDIFYQSIAEKIDKVNALLLIRKALLFLDDAAIFTLHGFCKRVLNQYAFDNGLLFNLQMELSGKAQTIEAVQDWYRVLAKSDPEKYMQVAEYWPDPTSFIPVFGAAIGQSKTLFVVSAEDIIQQLKILANTALSSIQSAQSFLFEHLVDNQKKEKKAERENEFNQLIQWFNKLIDVSDEHVAELENMPTAFLDGRRFGRSTVKTEIIDIFSPANLVKKANQGIVDKLNKASAYQIVANGITTITKQISAKKKQQSLLSFDDLIEVLAKTLANEEDSTLAKQLYHQFPVAMVDEFQDTDPYQFSILQHIYQAQDSSALYLIGDPKQAIYGFRGGDIFTYLSARDFCQHQWVMDTNWRSTAQMITGYNRLFYGNTLSQTPKNIFGQHISYHPVNASNTVSAIPLLDNDKALQFIHFEPEHEKQGKIKPVFRSVMAQWLANKIVNLLSHNHNLSASDIAILVRDGTEAAIVKEALNNSGLVSVYLSNRSNLWHSAQAQQLLLVLKGVLYYENDRFFNAALASGILGFTAQTLHELQHDELAWQEIKFSFKALRELWEHKGFISAALKLLHQHLAIEQEGKERALTNLLHLVELLQAESARYHQPQELLFWFEQQLIDEAGSDTELRLESDEQLIKIVTQHGSKGLEYPIVFIPFGTRHKPPGKMGRRNITVVNYHDTHGVLHTALEGTNAQRQAMYEEAYAESIRLLYVAVTRAAQRCYMLVTNFDDCHLSPLGQTLGLSPQSELEAVLALLSAQHPESIGIETISDDVAIDLFNTKAVTYVKAQTLPAIFAGRIERDWWLSSFTSLSRNLRHGGISLPDRDVEAQPQALSVNYGQSGHIRFDIVKGAHTGNLLHDIMEQVDFDQHNWQDVICQQKSAYASVLETWKIDELAAWMEAVVDTPLADTWSLSAISEQHTLKEQEFYFPMMQASSQKLAQLLITHRRRIAPDMQPSTVKLPAYQQLKGMMHGFIDLIFEHQGKFYVCDYKSTYLGNDVTHYQQHRLQQDIANNYYDLQYLIYSLALHRLLKTRHANYDPEQHFGGVYYLYLRGMDSQSVNGVFFTHITKEELNELDVLFAGALS